MLRILKLAITLLVISIPLLILQDCTARDAMLQEINRIQLAVWSNKR